jgi:isochorismate synthase
LARLRAAYPDCYTFLSDPGAGRAFVGATPERLARMDPGTVTLGALAGTFPRGATPAADAALKRLMLENPKEREEHAIVVDAIRAALAGLGRLDIPDEPEVRAFKNVWHLFTPVFLTPSARVSLLSLVERLHPTPAVGGLPREAALEAVRRLETFDRGWYGAPLGWLNGRGEGEFAVALRAGLVSTDSAQSGSVRLIAGGGIVADSDPEREFEETRIKFQPMLGALGQE